MIYPPKDGGMKPPLPFVMLNLPTTDHAAGCDSLNRLKPVLPKPSDFGELAAFQGRRDRGVHQQFREMLGRVIQFIDTLADELVVAAGGSFLQRGNAGGDFRAFLRGQTGHLRICQGFCGRGQYGFGFSARFDQLALGKILLRVFDGFLEHTLDLGIVDAVTGLDFDGMPFAGAQIFRGNLQDAVGVDQESHLDALQARGSRRNFQREAGEGTAIFGEFALALKNVNVNAGLMVDASGVKLLRAGGNRGVARNDFRNGTAVGFDAQRERRDVEEQHVVHAAVEDVGLDGGAEGDDFVGIQFRMRLAVKKLLDHAADQRGARGAANEDNFLNVGRLELGVGESLLERHDRAVHDGANERLEFAASEFAHENAAVRQREPQRGGFGFRELMLQADQGFAEFLREFAMGRKIDFILLQDKLVDKSLQKIVDIVATEVRVAVGGEHLIDVAVVGGDELQDGNIKRAAAEIVDGNFAALLFVQAVGQRRGSRLVDETENFQTGDFASVFGGLALRVVEIRRHGDDGAIDGFAEERFRPVFQFAQNECRNFRRSEDFVAQHHANYVFT